MPDPNSSFEQTMARAGSGFAQRQAALHAASSAASTTWAARAASPPLSPMGQAHLAEAVAMHSTNPLQPMYPKFGLRGPGRNILPTEMPPGFLDVARSRARAAGSYMAGAGRGAGRAGMGAITAGGGYAYGGGRSAMRAGRSVGKLGLYGGALLAGMGVIGSIGGLYEANRAGQEWKEEEESDYMQKLLATAQQGPFGTGLRPYGMGNNFGGSAGMSLAMHYARNGTGMRNPLYNLAALASRDVRGRLS